MKAIYKFFSILIIIAICTSCEEVTDINLKSADPRLVIDATISSSHPCTVYLTKSQAFNNNDPYQGVKGAIIELTNEEGIKEKLIESNRKAGLYTGTTLGKANSIYNLKISVEGKVYESRAILPEVVTIDSMYMYNLKVGKEDNLMPTIIFDDPKGIENFYYSNITVNNYKLLNRYLDTDEYQDGVEKINNILFVNPESNKDEKLKIGDTVFVELQNINEGAFIYYNSLNTVAAGGATNPLSNISGEVLGCFKAYSSSVKEIIISENNIFTKK